MYVCNSWQNFNVTRRAGLSTTAAEPAMCSLPDMHLNDKLRLLCVGSH